ncbi:MAG: hypothetical protein AB8H03_23400 [Saprospiraceae bacterium]
MKNFLLLFTFLTVFSFGCKDDDEVMDDTPYAVDITISAPTANAVVNMNEAMAVKVDFARGAEEVIHHVKIFVLDADGNTIATLLESHAHTAGSFGYDDAAAYTPTAAGTYKIKAVSHDMDGVHADPLEVTFTVQ